MNSFCVIMIGRSVSLRLASVTVELDRGGENTPLQCRLFDLSGRELRNFQIADDTFDVDVSEYPSGIYLLRIQSVDGALHQVVKVIWNACVYVVDVKDEVAPRLTYKATVSHTCRQRIKLMAGVTTNVNATRPEHTIEWAVFNFQGGEHYMQGDSTETGRTLELGLDVSRLLEYITPGQPAKFFLEVVENDPDGVSEGEIVAFSLMDYRSNFPTETACTQANVPIVNNDTTFLSVVSSVDFTRPQMAPNPPVMTAFRRGG